MVCRYVNWSVAPPVNDDAPALLASGDVNVAADAVTSSRWELLLLEVSVVSEDDASTVAKTFIELLFLFNSMDFSSFSSLLVIAAALTRQLNVFPPCGPFPRPKPNMFESGNRIATVVHTKLHIIVKTQRSGHRVMIDLYC